MALPIFPTSPLPADIERDPFWNTNDVDYDSGASQSTTSFVRPMYRYSIGFKNINNLKQSSLHAFYNARKSTVEPFLIKDPVDYQVSSQLAVRSGLTTGTFALFTADSFYTLADSLTVGSLFSTLSGYVRLGTNYWHDQDTGVMSVITKASTDVWGFRSAEYYKKCKFDGRFAERVIITGQFQIGIKIKEIV